MLNSAPVPPHPDTIKIYEVMNEHGDTCLSQQLGSPWSTKNSIKEGREEEGKKKLRYGRVERG